MSDLLIDLPAAVAVAMMPSAVAVVPMSMELVTLLYCLCWNNCGSLSPCCRNTESSAKPNTNRGKRRQNAHSHFRYFGSPFGFRASAVVTFVAEVSPHRAIATAMVLAFLYGTVTGDTLIAVPSPPRVSVGRTGVGDARTLEAQHDFAFGVTAIT